MDRSKVSAAGDVTFVSDVSGQRADVVIVDLGRLRDLDILGTIESPRIIGFGSHVDRELLDRARAAGCTEVLARSAFFNRLSDIVG